MKPKDYRQLLKLEAPAWGEGKGETKSGKARCSPMLVCQFWRILIATIVLASTWIVTLGLIDISAWKQMYFPKKSFQYYGSWRSILFRLESHSGSLCDLCALNKTHTISLWIILGNISSAVTEQLFFCATWFAIYEKQQNPLAPLISVWVPHLKQINGALHTRMRSQHRVAVPPRVWTSFRFRKGWGNGIIVWLPKPGVKGEEVEGLSVWVFEGLFRLFLFGGWNLLTTSALELLFVL